MPHSRHEPDAPASGWGYDSSLMPFILRVNLSDLTVTREDVPDEYALLGGRALTSRIVLREVDPACDPLGPESKLVFAPGLLGGTAATTSGRTSFGGKSPLMGGCKEANVGGTLGHRLSRLGIKAVIVEGAPPDDAWRVLRIDAAGARLERGAGGPRRPRHVRDGRAPARWQHPHDERRLHRPGGRAAARRRRRSRRTTRRAARRATPRAAAWAR